MASVPEEFDDEYESSQGEEDEEAQPVYEPEYETGSSGDESEDSEGGHSYVSDEEEDLIQMDGGDDQRYPIPGAAAAPFEMEPAYDEDDDDIDYEGGDYDDEYRLQDVNWPAPEEYEGEFENNLQDDGEEIYDQEFDEIYDYDDEREEKKSKPKGALKRKRRRRRRCCMLICCCLCLLLLLLLGMGMYILLKPDDEEIIEEDDYVPPPDDDFTAHTPYEGIKTEQLDPLERGDCYFGDNVFPHVIQQCDCFESIDIIPNETVALYNIIREDIDNEFYNNTYAEPMNSCDPINMAMVWLSSGNTRDAGDLYQRFTLAMSYFTTNGTNWDIQYLWLSDESECVWFNIQCTQRFRINSLALDAQNLHGSIATEYAKLQGLRVLALSRNHMTGTIPTEILHMTNLQVLLLNNNQLHGNIPTEIALATKLREFQIGGNLHFGIIPDEIGQATSLEKLGIEFNDFWRRIPTAMGLLSNMKSLSMEDNRLSGELPTEFASMTNLEYLLMSKNLLRGPLPVEYAAMTNLQELRAARTGIGGVLSNQFASMNKLHRLELGGNNFRGTIMTEFGNMTGLSWLSLNDNDLTGTIPTELGNLVNMTRLSLEDCVLTGEIPSELGRMTVLEDLNLDKNDLSSRAPEEVCDLRLRELNLFVTDCPSRGGAGVVCPVPQCCTFCRRGDSSGSNKGNS
jgi:Leucine-rich repeat (LRR) protein